MEKKKKKRRFQLLQLALAFSLVCTVFFYVRIQSDCSFFEKYFLIAIDKDFTQDV